MAHRLEQSTILIHLKPLSEGYLELEIDKWIRIEWSKIKQCYHQCKDEIRACNRYSVGNQMDSRYRWSNNRHSQKVQYTMHDSVIFLSR